MSFPDILSYRSHLPMNKVRFLVGFLLATGFCLQNVKLIPSLPGEYQPLIFLAGCCLAILAWQVPKPARNATLILLISLPLSVLAHYFLVEPKLPSIADSLRFTVGPLILAGVAAAWQKIDHRWLWGILVASLLFAAIGTIHSEWTTSLISNLNVRINEGGNAYAPWAAFFFSEYSFAALAFAAIFAWLNARSELSNRQHWGLLVVSTLLIGLTRSGTGFALIGIILLSQLRPKYWIIGLAILAAGFFVSPRIERLITAIWQIAHGNLEQFVVIDGSTAWRFLSNLLALKVELANPLGTMGIDLRPFASALQFDSINIQNLADYFLLGPVYAPAQGVFFNYGLFGGLILQAALIVTMIMAARNIGAFSTSKAMAVALLAAYGFFIQSGLTSPVPWILLGILLSPPEKC